MKLLLITDQHFGCRNDSDIFMKANEIFFRDIVFPYIDKHNIKTVVDLGDTFDRRKYINFKTLNEANRIWFDEINKRNIDLRVIIGNHTAFYKNTNDVNSLMIYKDKYTVYSETTEVEFDNTKILFVPWINQENQEDTFKKMDKSTSQVLFGHLELAGYEMYKGSVVSHGYDVELFKKFDIVLSGHFHHKSSDGHIFYLGNPTETTWADYNDPKGFHIFDTQTRELEFIANPNRLFKKVWYNDSKIDLEWILSQDFDEYKDTFVKLIVEEKNNQYWFDVFFDKLEKTSPHDIQVIENKISTFSTEDSIIIDESESTIDIFKKYIDKSQFKVDKTQLQKTMLELYQEAMSI